jgi:hypothetical protein
LAFSYWFDLTLVSQLREDLLLCSSYLPLGVPNELFLQAITRCRWLDQIRRQGLGVVAVRMHMG